MSAKTVRAIHANRGIEATYQRSLLEATKEMQRSVLYWLTVAYRKEPPRVAALVAEDSTPAQSIQQTMNDLSERWIKKFDEWSPKLAEAYLQGMYKASDSAFREALKASGWSVKFTMTPTVRDAFNASLQENVGLIRSIPVQYLQQVEGVVMRSYSAGRDLQAMVSGIKALYPTVGDRAHTIARDQSNKANAVVNRARQLELGITDAIWLHSAGGKTPRPDHVAANGKRYKIAKGCKISGEFIQPGELINCRCVSRAVLPY